jgi:hypothetical protein
MRRIDRASFAVGKSRTGMMNCLSEWLNRNGLNDLRAPVSPGMLSDGLIHQVGQIVRPHSDNLSDTQFYLEPRKLHGTRKEKARTNFVLLSSLPAIL